MHSGPAQVRFHDEHVSVLCPKGHVVTGAMLTTDFGGSALAAKISFHQAGVTSWVVECDGGPS